MTEKKQDTTESTNIIRQICYNSPYKKNKKGLTVKLIVDTKKTGNVVKFKNPLKVEISRLSLGAGRLLRYAITAIRKEDTDFKELLIHSSEYADFWGLNRDIKQNLKKWGQELRTPFVLNTDNGFTIPSFLSSFSLDDGVLALRFDEVLIPHLLNLENDFLSYRIENLQKIGNSMYNIMLYEIFVGELNKSKRKSHTLPLTIPEIRGMLTIPISLKTSDVKNILNRALMTFKKTDIRVSYTEKRKGNKIEYFNFTVKKATKNPEKSGFLSVMDLVNFLRERPNKIFYTATMPDISDFPLNLLISKKGFLYAQTSKEALNLGASYDNFDIMPKRAKQIFTTLHERVQKDSELKARILAL